MALALQVCATRSYLPLVRPAWRPVGLFHFLNVWNDFFFPLIFIRSETARFRWV